MSNPPTRTLAALAIAGLAAAASFLGIAPAQSVPADPDCPDVFPTAELAKGQPVDGLTVSTGTVPDEFTGEVIGVLNDGIAPDLDMILVRLTSTEIDRVGGIWAGMSGSPVYAADGRLIGAVAYGLAQGPSPVAGVTPAADMKELLDRAPEVAAVPQRQVPLSSPMQQRIVSSGAATSAEASSGLERLPVPVGVSGTYNAARFAKAAQHLGLSNVKLYRAGAAPTAPLAAPEAEIFAGSNLAGSLSYGDLSAVGTGTTTMVCDGEAVAFGHPFNFAGESTLTMHGADAVYIQEDLLVPFKVATATGPVGVIDQDRLAGIKGVLGEAPDTTLVHTVVNGPNGRSRTADTHVSVPEFAPDATAFAFLGSMDRVFDHIGKGSSLVTFNINGHTAAGQPFSVTRTNRYADSADITFPSIFEPADSVGSVLFNEFTDVTLDQVQLTSTLSAQDRSFRVGKVELRKDGVYRTLTSKSRIWAWPGRRLHFRITLASPKNQFGSRVVTTMVRVPFGTPRGTGGAVTLGSGSFGGDFEEEFEDGGYYEGEESGPESFQEVLDGIAKAPRNDELFATINLFSEYEESGTSVVRSKLVGDVLTNTRSFPIRIVKRF